jgi:hypothetical protein
MPVVDEAASSLLNRFPAGGTGLAAIALYSGQHNGVTQAELSMACKGASLPSSGAKQQLLVFLWAHVKDPELMQRVVHTHTKSELLALLQPCYQKVEMVEGLIERIHEKEKKKAEKEAAKKAPAKATVDVRAMGKVFGKIFGAGSKWSEPVKISVQASHLTYFQNKTEKIDLGSSQITNVFSVRFFFFSLGCCSRLFFIAFLGVS